MAPPPAGASSAWPWYAGGAALAIALTVAFLRRRRPEEQEEPEEQAFEPAAEPSAPAVLTRPAPPYAPPPSPSPPRPEPQPERPLPEPAAGPIEMEFEARHLSRAMVNATLAYRLTLTNRAASALGPLRIAGDIVTAHSSLSANDQLAAPDESLATVHAIDALAPGESASLSGELRLPLASILPIHSGGMRVFVPLARFRAAVEGGPSVTRIFVVGQESERPGGALRPFVLDRGPGVDRSLGQRQLGLPA